MEAHRAVPPKEDGAVHSLVENRKHPYSKGSRRCTIMVESHGRPSLSVGVKHSLGAELAPRVGCGGSDVGCIDGAGCNHLVEWSMND